MVRGSGIDTGLGMNSDIDSGKVMDLGIGPDID